MLARIDFKASCVMFLAPTEIKDMEKKHWQDELEVFRVKSSGCQAMMITLYADAGYLCMDMEGDGNCGAEMAMTFSDA